MCKDGPKVGPSPMMQIHPMQMRWRLFLGHLTTHLFLLPPLSQRSHKAAPFLLLFRTTPVIVTVSSHSFGFAGIGQFTMRYPSGHPITCIFCFSAQKNGPFGPDLFVFWKSTIVFLC